VNVAVREVPGQGRVTLAPQHISPGACAWRRAAPAHTPKNAFGKRCHLCCAGDILAVIPRQSCFVAAADEWVRVPG
jgi:hypothetical protein